MDEKNKYKCDKCKKDLEFLGYYASDVEYKIYMCLDCNKEKHIQK